MRRILILAAFLAIVPGAHAKGPGFRLHKVGTFDNPVYVTASPGGRHRIYVVEQTGVIRVVKDGKTLAKPFLDIRDRTRFDDEQGLLSMAFAPDFATSKRFYVFYTDKDAKERIEEYRATSGDSADVSTARTVLLEDDPAENHNGGQLQFGPDGKLYVSNGDGGGLEQDLDHYNLAQDPNSVFGKILRLDPLSDAPPEIYQSGLRNPWRFSFDRMTGAMIVTDVGRSIAEEVNYFKPGQGEGADLGWPAYEGRTRTKSDETVKNPVMPVLIKNHTSDNFCAITGGYVSRDPKVKATFGRYLFGDFCHGDIFSAHLRQPAGTSFDTGVHVPQLVSFGEDGRARVYVVSIGGPVYRIVKT